VADQAGVSHRTVYRHYPSREALLEGLGDWLHERFEENLGPEDALYADIVGGVMISFETMDRFADQMKAYVALQKGMHATVSRRRRRTDRVRRGIEKGPASHLDREQARAVSAMCRAMISSTMWHELTVELGLDGQTAGRVASWALRTLFDELERGGGPSLDDDQENE
jgi:AcrR family transcriptional regulator